MNGFLGSLRDKDLWQHRGFIRMIDEKVSAGGDSAVERVSCKNGRFEKFPDSLISQRRDRGGIGNHQIHYRKKT
ncbi:MAG: hypothetical protein E5X84_33925 [Mesorhizobium sp.]|nr:MAG: hypothetical protein E5X84_33925 [Mesorhizobium sp.]